MLIAHQGGWDEILLVLAPIAVIVGLLRLASTRAARLAQERDLEMPDDQNPPVSDLDRPQD